MVPPAIWQDGRHGAVLYVHRQQPQEFDLPGDEYESEIEYLRFEPGEGWRGLGSGGGGWINPFLAPSDLLEKYVVLPCGIAGYRDGDNQLNFTGALCRDDVAFVEVVDAEGVKRHVVDQERYLFVVGAYGAPALVRIFDEVGATIAGRDASAIELALS